jgi:hypothetical protein
MTIKNKDINTLNKLLFYSRELFKIKLSYKKKTKISDNFENQKLYKMYKDLKKEIARLSSLL